MTSTDISTLAHAHVCVWQGTVYRFRVGWIAAEQLADPALARVLVQVHAIRASHPQNRAAATLYVMASTHQPARIPLLLTDALHQHLATRGADGCAAHPPERPGFLRWLCGDEHAMIYFFAKGSQFTQCEIHPGQPHLVRVLYPLGTEHTESFSSSDDLADRWGAITHELRQDGWFGPYGRDARA